MKASAPSIMRTIGLVTRPKLPEKRNANIGGRRGGGVGAEGRGRRQLQGFKPKLWNGDKA